MSDRVIRFKTPAKINTFLFIQSKRDDGYHDLVMDLIPISLFDEIELRPTPHDQVNLSSNLPDVPQEENLVVQAIRLLEKESGQTLSLDVHLHKVIPSGAGLGGGSGNAAGTMVTVNQLFQLNIPEQRLAQLAVQLGADVPFFINPRPSLAKGIGERLTDLSYFDPLKLILIFPDFSISTGLAYSICLKSGRSELLHRYLPSDFGEFDPDINDFWIPLQNKYPALETCRQSMVDQGAVFAGLSGSGSTVFGIYDCEKTREKAFEALKTHPSWKVFTCNTLSAFQYEN